MSDDLPFPRLLIWSRCKLFLLLTLAAAVGSRRVVPVTSESFRMEADESLQHLLIAALWSLRFPLLRGEPWASAEDFNAVLPPFSRFLVPSNFTVVSLLTFFVLCHAVA
jgi:hypothetical protein